MEHSAFHDVASELFPGVFCRLYHISFERRLDLLKEIGSLARRHEHAAAGESIGEKYNAAVLDAEINKRYWFTLVHSLSGLSIDGEPATPEAVWKWGPDALVSEMLSAIKSALFLSPLETKN